MSTQMTRDMLWYNPSTRRKAHPFPTSIPSLQSTLCSGFCCFRPPPSPSPSLPPPPHQSPLPSSSSPARPSVFVLAPSAPSLLDQTPLPHQNLDPVKGGKWNFKQVSAVSDTRLCCYTGRELCHSSDLRSAICFSPVCRTHCSAVWINRKLLTVKALLFFPPLYRPQTHQTELSSGLSLTDTLPSYPTRGRCLPAQTETLL